MAGNHQVLVGLDHIGGDAAPGHADARPALAVGGLVELQTEPAASAANGGTNRCRILADTGGEDDPVETAEGRGERADLESGAMVKDLQRKPRSGLLARQQLTEIEETPESPSMPERR